MSLNKKTCVPCQGGIPPLNAKEINVLIKQLNGQLYECCFIIDLPELGGSKKLLDDGHNVYSILSLEEK